METVTDFIYWTPKSLQMVTAAMKLKDACSLEKSYDQLRQRIKKQRHYFANKGPSSQMIFSVVIYGCESWTIKKAESQRADAFEVWCWRRLLRVPWTARRSNESVLKEIKYWISIWRTDAEAAAPILWSPDTKSQLIRKNPEAGKDWEQEEEQMTEDEMVRWHHWLKGANSRI